MVAQSKKRHSGAYSDSDLDKPPKKKVFAGLESCEYLPSQSTWLGARMVASETVHMGLVPSWPQSFPSLDLGTDTQL